MPTLPPAQPTIISHAEWQARFRPGQELGIHDPSVQSAAPRTIWTALLCDEGVTIVNGWHFVNREAYYLCAVPFADGALYEVD